MMDIMDKNEKFGLILQNKRNKSKLEEAINKQKKIVEIN